MPNVFKPSLPTLQPIAAYIYACHQAFNGTQQAAVDCLQGADEAVKAYEAEIQQLSRDVRSRGQQLQEAQTRAQAAQNQVEICNSQLQSLRKDLQVAEEQLQRQAAVADTHAGRNTELLARKSEAQLALEESPQRGEVLEGDLTELQALRYEVTAMRNANGVLQKLNSKGSSNQVRLLCHSQALVSCLRDIYETCTVWHAFRITSYTFKS